MNPQHQELMDRVLHQVRSDWERASSIARRGGIGTSTASTVLVELERLRLIERKATFDSDSNGQKRETRSYWTYRRREACGGKESGLCPR